MTLLVKLINLKFEYVTIILFYFSNLYFFRDDRREWTWIEFIYEI